MPRKGASEVGEEDCGACTAGPAAASLAGHTGSSPGHFRAGLGSAERNSEWEHVANFKPMAVKIFLFFGKTNQSVYSCPFSAGSAFTISKDLASAGSGKKMSCKIILTTILQRGTSTGDSSLLQLQIRVKDCLHLEIQMV